MDASLQYSAKTRRLLFGVALLIIVNVLWVASSEISKSDEDEDNMEKFELGKIVPENNLSQPSYEPIHKGSDSSEISSLASVSEAEENVKEPKKMRLVKFNKVKEVRRMPGGLLNNPWHTPSPSLARPLMASIFYFGFYSAFEADAALLARLPHDAWIKVSRFLKQHRHKLSVRKVAELSLQFTFVWFLGNYAYLEALKYTEAAVVNVLSSTSSLFTLILAAIFPSCPSDKFTLSKFCIVSLSIFGICIVTYADKGSLEVGVPKGAAWSLVGSLCYALYLVLLRRRVDSEEKLDIPMFFGFVGLFSALFMWPGMYILHITNMEPFYPLPNQTQFLYLMINGIIGTVLSEYLWLCGCFLTSSLTATLSLGLTIPMTILADCLLRRTNYSLTFYFGFIPILLSVVFSSLIIHYDNWDPVYGSLCRIFSFFAFYFRLFYEKIFFPTKHQNGELIKMKYKNSSDEIERLMDDS